MAEWSNEQSMKFLEAYKMEPVIWNPENKHHKEKKKVMNAWKRLSESLDVPIDGLKRKKEVLMGTFRRHLKRKQKAEQEGDEDGYEPMWFAYSFMESFLLPLYTSKTTSRHADTTNDSEPAPEYLKFLDPESEEEPEVFIKRETPKPKPQILTRKRPDWNFPAENTLEKRRTISGHFGVTNQSNNSRLHQGYSNSSVISPKSAYRNDDKDGFSGKFLRRIEKDECDSFGEYIADSLRKHDEKTRCVIKQAMNNIIFEQEMKKYNANRYTLEFDGKEENPLQDDSE